MAPGLEPLDLATQPRMNGAGVRAHHQVNGGNGGVSERAGEGVVEEEVFETAQHQEEPEVPRGGWVSRRIAEEARNTRRGPEDGTVFYDTDTGGRDPSPGEHPGDHGGANAG